MASYDSDFPHEWGTQCPEREPGLPHACLTATHHSDPRVCACAWCGARDPVDAEPMG